MRNRLQHGVGHIALVLVVLVFGAIGAIGYTLYAHPGNGKGNAPTSTTGPRTNETTLNVPAAPTIKTAADLDKAESVLNEVDPGANAKNDEAQLEAQLGSL